MHIPDNYLSPQTCAVMGAAMVPVWALAVRKVKNEVSRERIPLLGIGAAFSFLIMMFNVPLPGGTTGHAVGGTLLAVLLGPEAACISITIALLIQALMFGDGGILAFGANCFNMAFVTPFAGYFTYRLVRLFVKSKRGDWIGLALGSYVGINVGALCAAVEFGLQPLLFRNAAGLPLYCPYPLAVSIPAMLIPHLVVAGVIEAVFTVAIVAFVSRVSPGTVYADTAPKMKPLMALIAVLVALSPLGLLAAGTAWGEWSADEIRNVTTGGQALGFVPDAMKRGFGYSALAADYGVKGLPAAFGYVLSAVAGAAILVILFKLAGHLRKGGSRGKV
jgi:cobalt/nickel transport system permease protein